MNGRVKPFGPPAGTVKPAALPVFHTKATPETPVAPEGLDRIADKFEFPSRQARTPPAKRRRKKRSPYTAPIYIRTTQDARDAFEQMAEDKSVSHGLLFEQAVAALQRLENARLNQASQVASE